MKSCLALSVLFFFACLLVSEVVLAGDCAPVRSGMGVSQLDSIKLNGGGGSGALSEAISMWNSKCGERIPRFKTSGTGDVEVDINISSGPNDLPPELDCDDCGCGAGFFEGPPDDQMLTGGVVWVFGQTAGGMPCTNPIQTFTHELGHVLGFRDATCPSCSDRIMYQFAAPANVNVTNADCAKINSMYETTIENTIPICIGEFGEIIPCSPLVLDLDQDGYILTTGVSEPVRFDIDGDGSKNTITWTFWESNEGILWLDLNDNGAADNGHELFGNATLLQSGERARHGFEALAQYDAFEHGGNEDGIVSSSDKIWESLRLWTDSNHDGRSQPKEISRLDTYGIVGIGLDFLKSDFIDGAGNGRFLQGIFMVRRTNLGISTIKTLSVHDIFFAQVGGS